MNACVVPTCSNVASARGQLHYRPDGSKLVAPEYVNLCVKHEREATSPEALRDLVFSAGQEMPPTGPEPLSTVSRLVEYLREHGPTESAKAYKALGIPTNYTTRAKAIARGLIREVSRDPIVIEAVPKPFEVGANVEDHVNEDTIAELVTETMGSAPGVSLEDRVRSMCRGLEAYRKRTVETDERLAEVNDILEDLRNTLGAGPEDDLVEAVYKLQHQVDTRGLRAEAAEARATEAERRLEAYRRTSVSSQKELLRRHNALTQLERCVVWREHGTPDERHPLLDDEIPVELHDELDLALRARLEDLAFAGLEGR